MTANEALDLLQRHRSGERLSHRLMIDADGACREHAARGAYITKDEVRQALKAAAAPVSSKTYRADVIAQTVIEDAAEALGIDLETDDD